MTDTPNNTPNNTPETPIPPTPGTQLDTPLNAPIRYMQYFAGNRTSTIIVGVLMALLGLLFFVFPLPSMVFTGIFVIAGLLIYGVHNVVSFLQTPSEHRDGWQLAQGIVLVVCSAFILVSSFSNAANILVTFAFMLGFMSMMVGVNEIVGFFSLKGQKGAGFILASGIINVLLAMFLIFAPIVASEALAIVQGVYLIFAGVALVIEAFAKRPKASTAQHKNSQ